MKSDPKADITALFGMPGMGKSYLTRFQTATHKRVLIHDPNAEDAWAEVGEVAETAQQLAALLKPSGPMRICWRGSHGVGSKEEGIEGFELGNRAALAAENLTLICDEIDRFTAPTAPLPSLFYRILNSSRHSRIRLYILARRPARVNRDLTSYANRMIVFRTMEPADLKYFRERSAALAAALPGLADHEAADWSVNGNVTVRKSPFK